MSSCNPQSIRLGELRAKTDRQLLMLITKHTRLVSDLLVAQADSENPKLLARAEKTYAFAVTFFPTIHNATEQEKQRVATIIRELRRRLEERRESHLCAVAH